MRRWGPTQWILVAFAVGVVAGLILGPDAAALRPLGDLLMNLLRMLVVPLIFSSLAAAMAGIGGAKLGRMFGKTFLYYYATAIAAVTIGLVLAIVTRVGTGMALGELVAPTIAEPPRLVDLLLGIVPINPIDAMARGAMLPTIFFAIMVGIATGMAGKVSEPVRNGLQAIAEVMYKMVTLVMWYAPLGVFGFIAWTVGRFGLDVLAPFAVLILIVYLGMALQALLIYGGLLRFIGKINPWRLLARVKEAPLFAFATCSSAATLPVTMRVTTAAGISPTTAGFVLPIGATLNMDGTAMYQMISAVFIANAFGIELTAGHYFTMALTAILASIATAGVPGAGLIMLTMVLKAVGLPLEGIALIAGIDRILDMARTSINVTDDIAAAAMVGVWEGERPEGSLNLAR